MPLRDLDQLPGNSRIWLFGAGKEIPAGRVDDMLRLVDRFLSRWAAHGEPIDSGRTMIDDTILLVAADEENAPGGCSLDDLFRFVAALEREFDVTLLEPLVFVRRDGRLESMTRAEFRSAAANGEIDADSIVVDTLIERLEEVRAGTLERRAGESWHAALLPQHA
jgi:hypothetical protein